MKHLKRCMALLLTSLLFLSSCGVVKKQNQFVLSSFFAVGGSANKELYTKMLRLTKESGINLVELTFSSGQALTTALDVCEQLQLHNLAQDLTQFSGFGSQAPAFTDEIARQTVQLLQQYQYNAGFYIWDEPTKEYFADVRHIKDTFTNLAPEKLAFSCIYPSYSGYTWHNGSYPAYVDEYIQTVDPAILSMDYYPYQDGSSELFGSDLWRDMGYFRKKSIETDKPFWFYFQAVGDLQEKVPGFMTVEKTKAQMYAALCYGVKGLSYYTSYGALVTPEGEKSAQYDELTAVNTRVKAMGNFLYDKTSQAVYHTYLSQQEREEFFLDDPAQAPFTISASDALIIGVFTDNQNTHILIVNPWINDKRAQSGTLTFPHTVKFTDFDTGKTTKGQDVSFSITPGDAVLYTVQED